VINPFDPGYYGSQELRTFGFRAVGENVQVSKNCTIIGLANIAFGDNVRIDSAACIVATAGILTLEGFNHIGGQCHFCVAADLTFGAFAGTSQGVRIYTSSDDYSGRHLTGPTVPADLRGCKTRPIALGRHVTIGAGSVIMPGCSIGEGSAVGALSMVNRPLRAWGVYFGSPVRRLFDRARDVEALEKIAEARHARGSRALSLVS
jgi:galactoside O-acetyltransferase